MYNFNIHTKFDTILQKSFNNDKLITIGVKLDLFSTYKFNKHANAASLSELPYTLIIELYNNFTAYNNIIYIFNKFKIIYIFCI